MADKGQVHTQELQVLIAMSLLRLGADTRAARLFQEAIRPELVATGDAHPRLIGCLIDLLGVPAAERADRLREASRRAVEALEQGRALGLTVLTTVDPAYPPLLTHIPDPPIVLWVAGDAAVPSGPAVALVGSRNATPAGLEMARRLGGQLAEAGLVVVSGLARGVDAAVHRGALESGVTVAVLGNGADVVYPRHHNQLTEEITRAGALLTEFPPGTRPYASHFPLRNRIISGISRAVVVVEASERSGSLITARSALEQGRDVLAVPGNAVSGCYRGCHALIKDGARLVETVDDILDEVGWAPPDRASAGEGKPTPISGLAAEMVVGHPISVDELAARSGRPAAEWLAELGALEVAGKVTRTTGGSFVRLDGPATNRER